jgi:type II secretory pathway component PulF
VNPSFLPSFLTPKQKQNLNHYANYRRSRHRSRLDKRPPLWRQLITPTVFIILGVAVLIYVIRHSSF